MTASATRPGIDASIGADVQLDVLGVAAGYVDAIQALQDVSLRLCRGEILAVVGANGAGKTTLLRALSNLLPAERGRVTKGSIRFEGHDVTRESPGDLVRLGLVPVLEGRHCFKTMTVEENLIMGAVARGTGRIATRLDLDLVYHVFPSLAEKRTLKAGQASGGEQQMTVIGRALMARPKLLLLDEPSMGLAPFAIRAIFESLTQLSRDEGLTILFAEQNARLAQRYAHRTIVLTMGISQTFNDAAGSLDRLYFGDSPGA